MFIKTFIFLNFFNHFSEAVGPETIAQAFEIFKQSVADGDKDAINTCIKKLFPDAKPKNYINLNFSARIETSADLIKAYDFVLENLFIGKISIEDATAVANILSARREFMILTEIEPRIKFLEESLEKTYELDTTKTEEIITLKP